MLNRVLKEVLNFSLALVGLVSGIASLGSWSRGNAQVALRAVAGACLLFLVLRLSYYYLVVRLKEVQNNNAELVGQLEAAKRDAAERLKANESETAELLNKYRQAIIRVSDRQRPLYSEHLDLTVTIGENDDQDRVQERVTCMPSPQLVHKTIRPIVPTDRHQIARLEDLDFKCYAEEVAITVLPLIEAENLIRLWLVFEGSITEEVTWTAEYTPRGLWASLRRDGFDHLAWDDRLRTVDGGSSMTDFTLKLVFPPSDRPPQVRERNGLGSTASAAKLDTGQWIIEWRDPKPGGRRYEWDISVPELGK